MVSVSYNSRALNLLSAIFFSIAALISVVQIFDFESLLEAGGVIGFVGIFLALTQAAWAPDIISGLIILNSRLVEEGDVIEVEADKGDIVGVVFKTKMFHTEILDLVSNHRLMIKNARLREYTIHNLSKFASARGLRDMVTFNIGYEVEPDDVRAMFLHAFETAKEDDDVAIREQYPLEIHIADTGDHAIEWVVYYYLKEIKQLVATRQRFREVVLTEANKYGISLATPLRHKLLRSPDPDA